MKQLSLLAIAALLSVSVQAQELKLPSLSPTSKLTQEFSTSSIEVSYSRPSMRGRKIFGELVAFGNVWRTGANSATKVKFGEEVTIGGQTLKAGEYALYTIPGATEWEIILNKGVGNWGNAGYDKADDVARFKVAPKALDKNVQTFTINISNITYSTCNIELTWEKTKVIIPVKANNEERLNASIDKSINNPTIPYYQAANYYYETNQHLDKATIYVDKALEANPKAFWMWSLKARIAQKMGNKDAAIAAANKAMEAAKGSAFEAEYVNNMTKLINSYKKP
ncbi:hypothetical protein CAP35_06670 [Chitinophagaceae bacterium IBVUCB1]|nr:hypothetical protein CAP35_06670 [Chitinophagaceae bacterium IBVUCB1]